ncbi:MAG: hypothetical protein KC425_22585, partial [Anaerolineales bacterium]|nr:hypothetical protein [Anaerolineales bacterium]
MAAHSLDPLFAEFDDPTDDDWLAAAAASLKGKPLERVAGRTADGIPLQLLYRQADVADVPHLAALPGQFPYVRGTRPDGYLQQPWLVAQELAAGTPQEANAVLRAALARGETAVNLVPDRVTRDGGRVEERGASTGSASGERGGVRLVSVADVETVLDGIDLAGTPIFVRGGTAAL